MAETHISADDMRDVEMTPRKAEAEGVEDLGTSNQDVEMGEADNAAADSPPGERNEETSPVVQETPLRQQLDSSMEADASIVDDGAAARGGGPGSSADASDGPATPAKATQPGPAKSPAAAKGTPEKEVSAVERPSVDDDNARLCQKLYFALLTALFQELDLFHSEGHQKMLDPRKQLLVYHHAARLFDLRKNIMKALRSQTGAPEGLPAEYHRATLAAREQQRKSEELPKPEGLRERFVFGHEDAIKFVQPQQFPECARDSCVKLREKPHAKSDVVKQMSPFRAVINFWCNRNPLTLIDEPGLGIVLAVEHTQPTAFIVISPFLKEPEELTRLAVDQARLTCTNLGERLGDHLVNLVARDPIAWRAFIQRRASILAKGSLIIMQKILRSMQADTDREFEADMLRELQEELEASTARAKAAEELASTASKKLEELELSTAGPQKKEHKSWKVATDAKAFVEHCHGSEQALREELNTKVEEALLLEARAETMELAVDQQTQQIKLLEEQLAVAEMVTCDTSKERLAAKTKLGFAEAMAKDVLSKEKEAEKAEVREHKRKVEEVEESNYALLVEVSRKSQAVETIKRDAEASIKLASAEACEAEQRLVEELAGLKDQAEASRQRIAGVEQAIQGAEFAKKITDAKVKACKHEVATRADEVKRLKSELVLKAESVQHVSATSAQLKAEAAQMQTAVEEAKKHAAAAEQVVVDLRGVSDKSSAELQAKEAEVAELQEKCAKSESQIEDLAAATGALRNAAVASQEAKKQATASLPELLKSDGVWQQRCTSLQEDCRREKDSHVAASRRAEVAEQEAAKAAPLRSDLAVKTDTLQQVSDINAKLQLAATAAIENLEEANSRALLAERGTGELRSSNQQLRSDLEAKRTQVSDWATSKEALQYEMDTLTYKHRLAIEATEAAVKVACEAETSSKTDLQVKEDEILELENAYEALHAKAHSANEASAGALLRAEAAEQEAAKIPQLQSELELKSETLQQLSATNAKLQAEASEATQKMEETAARLRVGEKAEAQLRFTGALLKHELESKKQEVSAGVVAGQALWDGIELLSEKIRVAKHAAEATRKAAREEEVRMKASLEQNAEEVLKVQRSCEALKAEIQDTNEATSAANRRAEALEKETVNIPQVRGDLEVKSATLQQLSETNTQLKAQAEQTKPKWDEAKAELEACKEAVADSHTASEQLSSELERQVAEIRARQEAKRGIEVKLAASREAREAAEAATRSAEEATGDRLLLVLHAEVTYKEQADEVISIQNRSLALQSKKKKVEEALAAASARVEAARPGAADAIRLKVEIDTLSQVLRRVSALAEPLRAEAVEAEQKADAAAAPAENAEMEQEDMHAACQQTFKQLQDKADEVAALVAVVGEMRRDAAAVSERVAAAGTAAARAASATEAYQSRMRAAEASLQKKADEATSMDALCLSAHELERPAELPELLEWQALKALAGLGPEAERSGGTPVPEAIMEVDAHVEEWLSQLDVAVDIGASERSNAAADSKEAAPPSHVVKRRRLATKCNMRPVA